MQGMVRQEEIDSLLIDSTAGEHDDWAGQRASVGEVKLYDFKHPEKFSREQLRSLERIFERFARLLSTNLSAYIRTNLIVKIESVTPLSYQDYIYSLSQPTLVHVIQLDPLPGQAALEMNPAVVFPLFEQMMGGQQRPNHGIRQLTDVELVLFQRPLDRMLQCLTETWQDFVTFNPSVLRVEQDPQFAQVAAVNTPVVVVSLEVGIGDTYGMMSLCLPDVLVDALLHRLSLERLPESDAASGAVPRVGPALTAVTLPVIAELGRSDLAVSEIRALQPGDVIRLYRRVAEDVTVYVGDRPTLRGEVGRRGKKLFLRVTGRLDDRQPEVSDEPPVRESDDGADQAA